ncbi:hypothetical protein K458DRAFT_412245 [Lentithecium fluviatile CBS 122367]|uniref:F-box domain-containing protein n=1 Tax=Lentithecium fluviatile CBS 122367 TaxID=1168545 RepID=A0A6G1JLB4_9PLEO|nr:hypothetical protein K458DRAFT_412245 [Lentithecium fluviatile CBS 122367]
MSSQAQQKAALLTLPSELINEILSYFTADRDFEADWRIKASYDEQHREYKNKRGRSTLHKLCLVSKDVHRHAEPALYSWAAVGGDGPRDTEQLCAFVLRFASNLELAKRLKYVEVYSGWVDADDMAEQRRRSLAKIEESGTRLVLEKIALDTFGQARFNMWKTYFDMSFRDALVALVLQLSPDILHIAMPTTEFMPRAISDMHGLYSLEFTPKISLSKLQALCISFLVDPAFYPADSFGPFIHSLVPLDQLNYLKVDCSRFDLGETSQTQRFDFPSLRSLILHNFGDTPDTLATIVNGCQKLKTLQCSFNPPDSAPGDNALSADMSALERSLEKHKSTLQSLTIRLHDGRHRGLAAPITTLGEFPILTTLNIDTVTLLGAPWSSSASGPESRWWYENSPFRLSSRLPPCLTEFSLYNYHYFEDGVLVLRDLAEDCEMLPQLKMVYLYNMHNLNADWPRLSESFETKGVTLL